MSVGPNERVCAICCRPKVDDDVISGQIVKIIECYIGVNFEVTGSCSFRDIKKILINNFVEADIDDTIHRIALNVMLSTISHWYQWDGANKNS